MKILCLGDFHGKVPALKRVIKQENVKLVLCTGDLPDTEIERKLVFENWDMIGLGFDLMDIMGEKKYLKMVEKTMKSQIKVLEKLNSLNLPVIMIWGNSDYSKKWYKDDELANDYLIEDLVKEFENIKLIQSGTKIFKDVQILAHSGYRFPSHKGIGDRKISKTLKSENKKWNEQLKKLFSKINRNKTTIFLAHEPPFNTKLDYVRYKESPLYRKHIGDEYFLRYVKQKKPDFMVCGHMHENQGKIKINNTQVIDAGYGRAGQYCIIDTDKNKVKFF